MIKKRREILIMFCISIGIIARFLVMTIGHNFDFESYCIVGDIAGHFRNVYAETGRYNYGFPFFVIQGVLFRISQLCYNHSEWTYRVLIVSVLTLADLGIAVIIADKKSYFYSMLFLFATIFFLNKFCSFCAK